MTPELQMMLAALFPDAVEFRFVPWEKVIVPVWTVEDLISEIVRNGSFTKPVQMETEETVLEPITEKGDILAGMSLKTHIVFICIRRDGDFS